MVPVHVAAAHAVKVPYAAVAASLVQQHVAVAAREGRRHVVAGRACVQPLALLRAVGPSFLRV